MGSDSVTPFLKTQKQMGNFIGTNIKFRAFDFQFMKDAESGERLFEKVLETSKQWGTIENLMYVVGATKAEMLADIRKIVPDNFLLVPGVGAQVEVYNK
jgi:orotidine-5'-phosphate decarboxylase